ncbi:MAG: PilZ domain-containing protein [Candidatus Omnitrophica bacterium]|nr:PilZ domain-containing protein [Candidatus Omnitrophota bacterium]
MSWLGEERRRAIRVAYPYTIIIRTLQDSIFSTYTENISREGVKIIIREKLEIDSLIDLKIYVGKTPVVCKGRILWVKDKVSKYSEDLKVTGLFETGVGFYKIKEEDKLIIKNCEQKAGE